MKTILSLLIVFLILQAAFAQPSGFEYRGKLSPTVSKEKLPFGKTIHDISPDFCRFMVLPNKDALYLDQMLNRQRIYLGCTLPQFFKATGTRQDNFHYVQNDFDGMVDYVSTEISAVSGGKAKAAQGKGAQLSPEQSFILANADMGSAVKVKVLFRYRNDGSRVHEGEFAATVVPERQAEFPGGEKSLADYLKTMITDKISEAGPLDYIPQIDVKFIVDETGQVGQAKVINTNSGSKADRIIMEAIRNMPRWKPATNSKGKPVKQEVNLPFGTVGGC